MMQANSIKKHKERNTYKELIVHTVVQREKNTLKTYIAVWVACSVADPDSHHNLGLFSHLSQIQIRNPLKSVS